MRRRLLLLLVVAALAGGTAGAVRSAEAGKPAVVAARIPALASTSAEGPRCPIPPRYRDAFAAAARDTGLPIAMLVAVGQVESNLVHEAVSSAGARGLLQVMPSTAAELALDVDHPATNVLAGARYLRAMLDRFQSADFALAAYNAGPTAVDQAGGAPNSLVQAYVVNVSARWRSLAGCR
jgi:soluble lytic murein transglycosylase-like protein